MKTIDKPMKGYTQVYTGNGKGKQYYTQGVKARVGIEC